MKNLLKQREIVSIIFIIGLFVVVGLFNPQFLALENIFQIVNNSAVYAMVALGMCFVLFTGEIDVSIGAIVGLTAAITGKMLNGGASIFSVFIVAIVVGMAIGIINALGIVLFKIPSIIMTLGMMGIIRGFQYIYTNGQWLQDFPNEFLNISQETIGGTFGYVFASALVIAILLYFFTKKTTDGTGYEMTAIAACVIGGIALEGGQGSTFGAIIGSILMTSISSILVFLNFPSTFNNTITGGILIAIVVIGAISNQRTQENIRKERLRVRVEQGGE